MLTYTKKKNSRLLKNSLIITPVILHNIIKMQAIMINGKMKVTSLL